MQTVNRAAEAKLVEMVKSIKDESASWRAIQFHFSRLLEHYRSESQIKIATNLINDLLKNYQGQVFICADCTIFVVARDVTKALLDKLIFQLRYLFMDDPLSYNTDGSENEDFCRIYDLSVSWQDFAEITRRKMTSSRGQQGNLPVAKDEPHPADKGGIKYFNSSRLAAIERDLTNADLSKVLRRQPICAAVPSMMVRRVFDEIYINIAHLRSLLKVDVDLLSNRWLFKYLTQILDDRMLDMLRRNPVRYFEVPVSLNLNVQTLLSNQFSEFDATIKPATKVSIVIEIQIADVFADMPAFMAARELVQKLGYRVCLDGLTPLSFVQIDREKLGFDLVKLQWNADIESDLKSRESQALADAVKHCGANRVILCRCDSRAAIDYGQAMGVSLFQGRYLDMLMNPSSKIEN